MEGRKFQSHKFITLGVYERIPEPLQLLLWMMADDLVEQDYLQIFDLQKAVNGILICHSQEEPFYENIVKVECEAEFGFKEKVYIIDDETHSTMLLAEEY